MAAPTSTTEIEDVESFRRRARAWLADHMPRLPEGVTNGQLQRIDEEGTGARMRELQKILFDGGFAGLCYPTEYGGQGLTPAHQAAFTVESAPYEMPTGLNIPHLTILGPSILECCTEAQKQRFLPKLLSGEEIWVQLLSEPSGGSDLAGLVTRATRDGDVFYLNGSKIWSSGAFRADYALILTRTNWDVPKHSGITVFIMKIHQPGVEVQRIKMANGPEEFCQEFFDDVPLPIEDVVGEIDDGWSVASRLLFHERSAVSGASPYASGLGAGRLSAGEGINYDLVTLADDLGLSGDPEVRQLVAEAHVREVVARQLVVRTGQNIALGHVPPTAASITRLNGGMSYERRIDIVQQIMGRAMVAWEPGDPKGQRALDFLVRQGGSLGGGSLEMSRNIIAERVLGMPREYAADKDKPFNEVQHNKAH